jgi:uncharacterized protein
MKTRIDLSEFEKMYDSFDKGHDKRHFDEVRDFAVELGEKYAPKKLELIYVAATLHDIGLTVSRELHELEGYNFVKNNTKITEAYNTEELEEILEAIKEHRASTGKPRGIVAMIVSDADKVSAGTNRVFQRDFQWGEKNLTQLNHAGQLLVAAFHLKDKFGPYGSGTRLYFEESRRKQNETFGPIFEALKNYDLDKLEEFLKEPE